MTCKNCGAINIDEARFCTECGKPLEKAEDFQTQVANEAGETAFARSDPTEPDLPPEASEYSGDYESAEPSVPNDVPLFEEYPPVEAPVQEPADKALPAEQKEPFYKKLMPWLSAVLSLAVIALLFTTWIQTDAFPELADLTPFKMQVLRGAVSPTLQKLLTDTVADYAISAMLQLISFLLMIVILGCAFYITATIMNRRGVQVCGRIGFNASIVLSLIIIAFTILFTLLYREYEGIGDNVLTPTAFPFIVLFLSVIGRITLIKSFRRRPYGSALEGAHVGKLLLPPAILFIATAAASVITGYISGIIGSNEYYALSLANLVLSWCSVPLFILAGAGGLYLIFFGKMVPYKLSAVITLGVSAVVGFATLIYALLHGGAYISPVLPPSSLYSMTIRCFNIGAIGLLFQPAMPYMATVWYRRSRWWMHFIVLLLLPGATYLLAYLFCEIMDLTIVGVVSANVLALALDAAAVLLMVIFGREKADKIKKI
ncbi:MAG: zinc-ribbon domain-containing protein [Oscillospiraceae bacterium]|jgi:hypothetical protein